MYLFSELLDLFGEKHNYNPVVVSDNTGTIIRQ